MRILTNRMKINLTYRIWLLASVMTACLSCSDMPDMNIEPPVETDHVYVDIEFSGKVVYVVPAVDETGEPYEETVPIPNIKVSLLNSGTEVYTNSNGIFFIEDKGVDIGQKPDLRFRALFSDVDGHANGGKFIPKTFNEPVEVPIQNKPLQIIDFDVVLDRDYSR